MPSTSRPPVADLRERRRFARRQWRRRWLTWKPLLAVLVVVVLTTGGLWAVWGSSWFAVSAVQVEGTTSGALSSAEVRRAAAVPAGEPLAGVDLDAVRSRVEALAPVKAAEVTRQWPDQVVVRVEEREPVAVVRMAGTLRGMDEDGVLFRSYRRVPGDLPLVEAQVGADGDALRESAHVVGALPGDLAAEVALVEVETVDDIRLRLRDDRVVVWGSAAESEEKAEVLVALLERPGKVFDVTVPGRPTASGATDPDPGTSTAG